MSKDYLKAHIRTKAHELGFDDVGFAKAEQLTEEIKNYKTWLDNNYNAEMQWMARNIEKRENVLNILPEAKSVIVFAHSYFTGISHKEDNNKISRYAWGDDYHDIILKKLEIIEEFLKELSPAIKTKSYTDTGPILEKQWAVKSGIGWQGKNSLILNRNLGSYFFIGIIITSIEFDSDKTVKDYCSSCSKCIDACPTGAIIQDKVVDSNKCISYWTIEAKPNREIPQNIKENINGWAFGCDICQEVCPWNKHKPKITSETGFQPRHNETNFVPEEVFNMTEEEFRVRFAKSPIKRTKLNGIKRNLSI